MEADWEFELGEGAPEIDGAWPDRIDLCGEPERVSEISEATEVPGMTRALVEFNYKSSPVWTSKCDVWAVEEFDRDELDAPRDGELSAVGLYLDLLPRRRERWRRPECVRGACKRICDALRMVDLRQVRVDLVIRKAWFNAQEDCLGVTAYAIASGSDDRDARQRLGDALDALVDALRVIEPSGAAEGKLQ